MAFLPDVADTYSVLTQWVDISSVFGGPLLIVTGIALLVLGLGLIARFRLAWVFSLTLIVIIAGFEFVYSETVKVAIPMTILAIWLFMNSKAFNQPLSLEAFKHIRAKKKPKEDIGSSQGQLDATDEKPALAASSEALDLNPQAAKIVDQISDNVHKDLNKV
jgi:hypothetical protein